MIPASLERLGLGLLHRLDPERAHGLALAALAGAAAPLLGGGSAPSERLAVTALGRRFANPIGLAGGFDKNGEAIAGLFRLGFGFVEIGTVTPRPQPGNPRPRLFRLAEDGALINRMGFNNHGHDAVAAKVEAWRRRSPAASRILGVNVGANKESEDRIGDYVLGVRRFAALADYLAVNVSSPNTPGLRDLQTLAALDRLLGRVVEARAALSTGAATPILLKIAPDLAAADLADIVASVIRHGLDGLIVANTTLARPPLCDRAHAKEPGGLSGRPLFQRSTAILAEARRLAGPGLAIIGVGGVEDMETAFAKIAAGADLVQLYTGLIYRGPSLPARLTAGLAREMEGRGLASISEARDVESERWAAPGV